LRAAAREGEESNPATAQSRQFFGFTNLIGVSNMKKSLIALAVAGLVSAPAFAATSNVDVYGKVRFSVDHQDIDVGAAPLTSTKMWHVNDQASRIGFKGSEDLGGGLKAVWQIEQGLSGGLNNDVGGATIAGRNTFIGLAGGFGTAVVGKHDTPYKMAGSADVFGDTTADAQCSGGLGQCIIGRNGFDNRVANAIAYISPNFSGMTVMAAIVPGESKANDGLSDSYSLAGVYKNGPLNASLAYEKLVGSPAVAAVAADLLVDPIVIGSAAVAAKQDKDALKLNVGYAFGDVKLGYTYESSDPTANVGAAQKKDKAHLLSVAYGMGPITLLGQYGQFDNKNAANADFDRWTIGAAYGLSKRTSAYVAYHSGDLETGAATSTEATVFTVGMNHDF
jgi:predicted porin